MTQLDKQKAQNKKKILQVSNKGKLCIWHVSPASVDSSQQESEQ